MTLVWSDQEVSSFYERLFQAAQKQFGNNCKKYFHLSFLARSKYVPGFLLQKGDKRIKTEQLQKKHVYSSQELTRVVQEFKSFVPDLSVYNLSLIPQQETKEEEEKREPGSCLVVYTQINPPSVEEVHAEMVKLLLLGTLKHENVLSYLKKEYGKNASKHHCLLKDLDIDTKDASHLKSIFDFLFHSKEASFEPLLFAILETKNGFHVIYQHKLMNQKQHKLLKDCIDYHKPLSVEKVSHVGETYRDPIISQNEGTMVPVPGTTQGGFPVKSISLSDWKKFA